MLTEYLLVFAGTQLAAYCFVRLSYAAGVRPLGAPTSAEAVGLSHAKLPRAAPDSGDVDVRLGWVHEPTLLVKAKAVLGLLVLFPPRFALMVLSELGALLASWVAMAGLTDEQIHNEPMAPWRRVWLRWTFRPCIKLLMISLGFIHVHRDGEPSHDAPVVISNHSSIADALVFMHELPNMMWTIMGGEYARVPLFSIFFKALQLYPVDRSSKEARQRTKDTIQRRCSEPGWPPMFVFPEGTTTAGHCLVRFKPGAFQPGKPVQMAVLRFPARFFTPSYSIPMGALLFLTMTQMYNLAEVDFRPGVYQPSTAERADPMLFAKGAEEAMAKALDVPLVDISGYGVWSKDQKEEFFKKRTKDDDE